MSLVQRNVARIVFISNEDTREVILPLSTKNSGTFFD